MTDGSAGATRTGEGVSELDRALRCGQFIVTAEVSPPVSTDPAEFVERALPLRGAATAVNVTDGAGAKTHLSSLVAAHFLLQHGIEPILQVTCRDRNRLALQADLLGAVALGIRNVLVLRGDEPRVGDQPEARPVFDLATTQVLAMAHGMRSERKLPSGTDIKGAVDLVLGAAETVVDPAPDWQPAGLLAKAEAGADFVQTQFCMDVEVGRRYAARLLDLGIAQRLPILIGVAPIPSARSARWMRERLFGTVIPDAIVDRLERAADPKAEGKRICIEVIRQLARVPGIAGAHVMAPQFHSALAAVIMESGVAGAPRAS
ncbi:MAG TPA: methylenetetrahydrofolate reductase [Burkholderiales bacterium]|nr:methylenetetrahydrofolate reductase [Burkholderiales bacterium]